MYILPQPGIDPSAGSPLRRMAFCLAGALVLAAAANAGDLVIEAAAIAAGGGPSRSPGGCLALDASIGQHTVGQSQGGEFTLDAGFWPAIGNHPTDSLFHDAFEECQ